MTEKVGVRGMMGSTSELLSQQCTLRVEEASEGLWAWDVQNNRIYWSNWLFSILGLPGQETPMSLDTMLERVHPDDHPIIKELASKCFHDGDPVELECRLRHTEGAYRTLSFRGRAYTEPEGSVSRISGLVLDVTAWKQIEKNLKNTQKKLEQLQYALDTSTIVAITDQHGVITYANQAFCDISKYSANELLGKTHRIINSDYHAKAFFEEMWQTIQAGLTWKGIIRNRNKDGDYYWVDTTIVPFLDEFGKPSQYIAIRHDISQQINAEKKLLDLNKELEARVHERTAQVQQVNLTLLREIDQRETMEQALRASLKREQLSRRLLQTLNHSFDIDFIARISAQEIGVFFKVDRCLIAHYAKEDNDSPHLAAQYCRSDDIAQIHELEIPSAILDLPKETDSESHHHILLNASTPEQFPDTLKFYLEKVGVQSILILEIRYREIPLGFVALHQTTHPHSWGKPDIFFLGTLATYIGAAFYQSNLHQQEEQARLSAEEASRQRTKILSYVSHDFKNPLASIQRFIQILKADKQDPLSEKQREILEYISEGVIMLRNMVTNILDQSRINSGAIVAVPEWFSPQALTEEVYRLLHDLALQKNIGVTIDIQPELHSIKADTTHMRQILINLLSNAIKYNRMNGTAVLRLYKSENERSLVISMEDTGKGIPPEKISMLFTDYYRANLGDYNLIEGTGLGLAFIKKLVSLYGGEVTVESEPDAGSTFKVLLPLTAQNEILPLNTVNNVITVESGI